MFNYDSRDTSTYQSFEETGEKKWGMRGGTWAGLWGFLSRDNTNEDIAKTPTEAGY